MNAFNNKVNGFVAIDVANSSWNNGFNKMPQTLNGDDYVANNSVVTHLIRNYWNGIGLPVFTLKSYKYSSEKRVSKTQTDKYIALFGENPKKFPDVLKNLVECVDVRNFGVLSSIENISLRFRGAAKFNMGYNLDDDAVCKSIRFQTPFASKEDMREATIGKVGKLDHAFFVHEFSVNPNNFNSEIIGAEGIQPYSKEDYKQFKEGVCNSFDPGTGYYRDGCNFATAVFVEAKPGCGVKYGNTSRILSYERGLENDRGVFDLTKLLQRLSKQADKINSVDITVNPDLVALVYESEEIRSGMEIADIIGIKECKLHDYYSGEEIL